MEPTNSSIKAAIFDIGATLITGPNAAPNKIIAGLLNGVSASDVSSVIMTHDLISAEQVCFAIESRFGKLDKKAIDEIVKLWNSQSSAAREIEGASNTVLSLKKSGFKIGLLSDIWNPYYESAKKAIPGVIDAADAIVLSCKSGSKKPEVDNYHRILSELNIKPDEAVMIGDTYTHDIYPAVSLGMKAVWVLARPQREAEWIVKILNNETPPPTATALNISEVPALCIWNR